MTTAFLLYDVYHQRFHKSAMPADMFNSLYNTSLQFSNKHRKTYNRALLRARAQNSTWPSMLHISQLSHSIVDDVQNKDPSFAHLSAAKQHRQVNSATVVDAVPPAPESNVVDAVPPAPESNVVDAVPPAATQLVDDLSPGEPQVCSYCESDAHISEDCHLHDNNESIKSLLSKDVPPTTSVHPQHKFTDVWQRWVHNEKDVQHRLTKTEIGQRNYIHQTPPLGFDIDDETQVSAFVNQYSFPKHTLLDDEIHFYDGHTIQGAVLRARLKNLNDLKVQLQDLSKKPHWGVLKHNQRVP